MMDWILEREPRSVLDIGAGSGTYGRTVRNVLPYPPYLIGVEVWSPYIGRYRLHDVYDHVINEDVRKMSLHEWPRADVVILGDVLEHMSLTDARRVWNLARAAARRAVFMSIPIVPYPQGAEHGNPFEEHVVPDWSHDRVMATFEGITWSWQGTIVGRYEASPAGDRS